MLGGALLLLGAGCVTPSDRVPPVPYQYESSAPAAKAPPADSELTAPPAARPLDNAKESMTKTWKHPGVLPASEIAGKQVRLATKKGEIVFKLYEGEAPKTVSNFVYLANGGFYDGLTFHRVEPSFVIQGGDPSGNGTGGPGYRFEDEPVKRQYTAGIVAMANAGPDTNGSQFFIMLEDNPLPPNYTIFGEVTKGMDVVRSIRVGDIMTKVSVEPHK